MDEKIGHEINLKNPRMKAASFRTPVWVKLVMALLVLLVCATSVVAFNLYKNNKQSAVILPTDDKKVIIINIAKHVMLPTGEEPVFATVTDPKKLSDQPFFANAETGDKVLVYPVAQKAILYRPSIDRIIQMAPFDPAATTGNP